MCVLHSPACPSGRAFLHAAGLPLLRYTTGSSCSGPIMTATSAPLLLHRFHSPLGPMFVCASEQGVCLLEFAVSQRNEREFAELQRLLHTRIIAGENDHTRQAEREIGEYFAGTRQQFEVALHLPGTGFQRQVWDALQQIPYGDTVSYQQQADRLGNPAAIRAVAGANGANRVSIIVPCHRVIGSNGSLTGFGGGLARKRALLALEGGGAQAELYDH